MGKATNNGGETAGEFDGHEIVGPYSYRKDSTAIEINLVDDGTFEYHHRSGDDFDRHEHDATGTWRGDVVAGVVHLTTTSGVLQSRFASGTYIPSKTLFIKALH